MTHPTRSPHGSALLLATAVWCFARFYYFAFYVIEHYVDPGYKFAGLGSFVAYLFRRRKGTGASSPPEGKDTVDPRNGPG